MKEDERSSGVTLEEVWDVFPNFYSVLKKVYAETHPREEILPNKSGGRWFTGNPDTAVAAFAVWDVFPTLRPDYVGPWKTQDGRTARPSFSMDWESESLKHCKDFRFGTIFRGDFATLKQRKLTCKMPHRDFSGTIFDNCTMLGADLSGSTLQKAKFARMSRRDREGWANFINFTGADLRGVDARSADMRQCKFDRAQIDGMSVDRARLLDSTFWGAIGALRGTETAIFGGDAWLSYTHRTAGDALHAYHQRPHSLLKGEIEVLRNARMVEIDDEGMPRLLPFGLRSLRRL